MGAFFPEFIGMSFLLFVMATVWQFTTVFLTVFMLHCFSICGSLSQTHTGQGARLRSVNPPSSPVNSRTCVPSQVT